MPLQIVALSGPLAGRAFPLGSAPLSLGRTPENTVVIASGLASRRHAELRPEGGGYVLYDLGSSNGTSVNGQRVQSHRLNPGDVITIGDESFRFVAPAMDRTLLATPPQPVPTQRAGMVTPPPPLPPMAGQGFGIPQGVPPAAPRPRSRLPIFIAVGLILACVVMAGIGGGVFLLTRSGGGGGGTTSATREPVATISAAGATPGPAPTRAAGGQDAAWTVLVYLDGDNNLESDALTDFAEMAQVGSSDQIKIVVQLDRVSSRESWDDTTAGNWDGTKRFLVEKGMRPTDSNAVEDLGEQNMGDPDVLADFVSWGISNYPAQRYALIIWDHGASWLGIASDDTSEDQLNLPELGAALETARQNTSYGTLDLIGFDACLMAQIDVLLAVEPYAQVAVASAELEPNQGWAWDTWLAALADDPGQDALAIAPKIVESYIDSYRFAGADEVTLSAFDLSKLAPLTQQVNRLSQAMLADMGRSYNAIGQARSYVDVYAPSYSEEFNAVDLGQFVELLPDQGATGEVAAAAADLGDALGQSRIANGAGSYHANSSGLSIYFPQLAELYVDSYERGSPLPRATKWADFLKGYHSAGDTAVTQPTISGLQIDSTLVSTSAPVRLSGSLSGSDIAYVFSFIGIPNASRDTVDLIYVDYVYPPGTTQGDDPPVWPDGQFDLSLTWDATSWYLSNGQSQIEALLGPVKYGSNFYGVEGVYTSQATGEQIDAGLIFNVQGDAGELVRIWGFPKSKQDSQPYELKPAPGDTFTAYTRSYTDTGGSLDPARVQGQTITFGDTPLTASYSSTLSGDYVMGFLVRDIAGNFSYDYVDVTVDNP
ncbi:FHA domain-containing protein [Chloroflexales bacterium ZM16-3]|nr:FHA domain-containing protein [Chloroflexales bacterium ZM16-3]